MQKTFIILTTAITLLTASQAQAIDARINGSNKYGCTSEEYYDKTTEMVAQNDREAFAKILGSGIETGICVMFKADEPVVIAKNGILMLKIRRRGDVAEYWVSSDAIVR